VAIHRKPHDYLSRQRLSTRALPWRLLAAVGHQVWQSEHHSASEETKGGQEDGYKDGQWEERADDKTDMKIGSGKNGQEDGY